MNWTKPSHGELAKAIDIYLALAYAGAAIPKAVQVRIDSLAGAPDHGLYEENAFEADAAKPSTRYALRLGNRCYPHMKLIIEQTPSAAGHLFRADTHDQHVRPKPGTRDAELFSQLAIQNQSIAEKIEAAWETAGLSTFKSYLRADLARRLAAGNAAASGKAALE